jgi:hypothetical protein
MLWKHGGCEARRVDSTGRWGAHALRHIHPPPPTRPTHTAAPVSHRGSSTTSSHRLWLLPVGVTTGMAAAPHPNAARLPLPQPRSYTHACRADTVAPRSRRPPAPLRPRAAAHNSSGAWPKAPAHLIPVPVPVPVPVTCAAAPTGHMAATSSSQALLDRRPCRDGSAVPGRAAWRWLHARGGRTVSSRPSARSHGRRHPYPGDTSRAAVQRGRPRRRGRPHR